MGCCYYWLPRIDYLIEFSEQPYYFPHFMDEATEVQRQLL